MIKQHLRGLSKSFGRQIDHGKSEELKRTKLDIENNLTRIVKFIKSEEQSKKDGNSRKDKEIVGLIEDFYDEYQSLYTLYGRLAGEYVKATPSVEGNTNRVSSVSSSSLESESEKVDANDSNPTSFSGERKRLILSNNTYEEEQKFTCNRRTEAFIQKKDFNDQVDAMQQQLDSVSNHNKELEREREVSQCLVGMQSVGVGESENPVENGVLKEAYFLARIKDLELEVEFRCSKQRVLEDRNNELERAMAQKDEEISQVWRERESCKEKASTHIKALTTEVENLRLELELQTERSQKEYSKSLSELENLKAQLEMRVADQEETIKKLTKTIEQMDAENKQDKSWSKKLELCQQLSERKMEDLAEKFQKIMEGNIRVLHQRIHVAEQLNNENKESHKRTKQRYEEEKKKVGERIASLPREVNLKGLEFGALNLAAGKLEEHREHVLGLVSKMMGEVEFAKDWIRERKEETKELKDKVDGLTILLDEKKEQEWLLRKRVWKLEAKVSKEGGEKLNLIKAVKQLERKVAKLEKILRDKDEELVSIAEKKREAIRQLCLLIEFHRNRFVYLKDLMSKRRASDKKWI
ncbi:hypothetical protein Fmac_001975 [Flemingia macrophylla]|uniref:NAB domain-containing protein n=1 Tax=Flemingia macrophylla TaxID=520843 RepID=A0ABD1NLD7_9FABA